MLTTYLSLMDSIKIKVTWIRFYRCGIIIIFMKMQNSFLWCFTLILLISTALSTSVSPSNGIFTTASPSSCNSHTYTFNGGGGNSYANVVLTFDIVAGVASVSQILMVVKASAPSSTDQMIATYQHASLTQSTSYDLENANLGRSQVVQLGNLAATDTINIYVINFNLKANCSYSIAVTELSGVNTSYCKGPAPNSNNIYCSNCLTTPYIGAFCDILPQTLSTSMSFNYQLGGYNGSGNSFIALTIPGSSSPITLSFIPSSINIYYCIQFKSSSSEVAGLINYTPSGGLNYTAQFNTQYTITINSAGTDVAVTFINLNTNSQNITVSYTVQSSTNVLLIVLAVLGGILLIALVIVAIYIVKRMRSSNSLVHPNSLSMLNGSSIRHGENVLTVQQIEMYFPSVLCRTVFQEQETSAEDLMSKGNPPADRDCVICLCGVASGDMMKVTYCNHIFHAHCLSEWFRKNRNCPYCREEFTKNATISHYQALLHSAHKNVLMSTQLVSEIVHSRSMKSKLMVQEIKDQ